MLSDSGTMVDRPSLGVATAAKEPVKWRCQWRLEKFLGDDQTQPPLEVIEDEGNLLVTAGATAMLNLLIGAGGTAFNNANAYIGVGDSSTAAAIGQTDLQAASNKTRKAMDSTFPSVSGAVVTFKSTFATGDANYAWNEFAIFNASSGGTMLNRAVSSLGTKTSAGSWSLTITITIS